MKVLYDEDLANRVSLESCGGSGNIAALGLVLLTGGETGAYKNATKIWQKLWFDVLFVISQRFRYVPLSSKG